MKNFFIKLWWNIRGVTSRRIKSRPPTVQGFTRGPGTYNVDKKATSIKVTMIGGGGGGSGGSGVVKIEEFKK